MLMNVVKRTGQMEKYCANKVINAIRKAFISTGEAFDESKLQEMTRQIEDEMKGIASPEVEQIQDLVEQALMRSGYYQVAKNYILYRQERTRRRSFRASITEAFEHGEEVDSVLTKVQRYFLDGKYSLERLWQKFMTFRKSGEADSELLRMLIKAAIELTTKDEPDWEFIAARLLMLQHRQELNARLQNLNIHSFYDKICYLTQEGLYGGYILESYSKEEIDQCERFIQSSRDDLLAYSGLELLLKRYVICDHTKHALESVQEMYLGIALHLAMKEQNDRLQWVAKFYDMLSTLSVTMATPTLSNARKPYHQLSSCFIDTVPDSLDGIYRSLDNFARVSKLGGGMGLYFGKVRAKGSAIRGFEGAAGGVIRWVRLTNDTAVAVDQLGVRQGAVAVYLDVWHRDLPEFLQLRTNNGDDRMKAHDVFPAICYPDYFWQQARDNIGGDWYLMCPHDIQRVKGYCLEDCFGDEWTEKYLDCVNDPHITKRVIPVKEIIRLIIKSAVETGTPFVFNRDLVNRMNPNAHKGIIYCSNLCTEIAQNTSAIDSVSQTIETKDGDTVVVTTTKPGDFVVCNLASLSLGRIDVNSRQEISDIVHTVVRALDNVIDLNLFPVPYAKINNHKYRPIGLGVSGYHHMLAKNRVRWESEEHLAFVDRVFEEINYAAIEASAQLAQEKGRYEYFEGSDWQTGAYFEKRSYSGRRWDKLKEKVSACGMRNAYLIAVAPTSSTSIIAGTTAGLDPIMNRFFYEEKKNGLMPRVAPDLSAQTYWLYRNAHLIDQMWSIRAAGVRQRHVDQAMSMNLYITNEYSFRGVLDLYIRAYEEKVKTIYYIRSKSLEVEDCEVCSS